MGQQLRFFHENTLDGGEGFGEDEGFDEPTYGARRADASTAANVDRTPSGPPAAASPLRDRSVPTRTPSPKSFAHRAAVKDVSVEMPPIQSKDFCSASLSFTYPPADDATCTALRAGLEDVLPGSTKDSVAQAVSECKSNKELHRVIRDVVLRHPLMFDTLNGHGFRVMMVAKLTATCTRLSNATIFMDFVRIVRTFGFRMTRFYAAAALQIFRAYIIARFVKEGRNPNIALTTIAYLKELHAWAIADGVPYDYVLYVRSIFNVINVVACFDRQNQYRITFSDNDVPRRDGVVAEWVLGHERCADFDEVVRLCDDYVETLVAHQRENCAVQPPYSFFMRLADYYFATDNFERMLATVEACRARGIEVSEVTVAKLMQLACAFNIPEAPQLVVRWRARHHTSLLAAPDVYRLLHYYGRSGGGLPCPKCGERYNHRNVGYHVWSRTPEHQRRCPLLQMGYKHKGVLEDTPNLPSTKDWSKIAFDLREFSDRRGLTWNELEWRGFILCCMFAPQEKARKAGELLVERFPLAQWDDFLKMQYLRLLRHHHAEVLLATVKQWLANGVHLSPLAYHEVLMGAANIDNDQLRVVTFDFCVQYGRQSDIFIMPYAKRYVKARSDSRTAPHLPGDAAADAARAKLMAQERQLVEWILAPARSTSRFNLKDSCADLIPGVSAIQQSQWTEAHTEAASHAVMNRTTAQSSS